MTPGGNERRNKAAEKKGKADARARERKGKESSQKRQAKERASKRNKYHGTGWCETFYTCKRGDGRNFRAWVKNQGYREYKGACAHSNGRYGKRHKYWHGKYTFTSCKAKCNSMGHKCQGITMPTSVRRARL
jgi:hypothetical protein